MNCSSSKILLLAAALTMLVAPRAPAQNLTLRWFSIDSGGGLSRAGEYSLQSCIGQPDAPYDLRSVTVAELASEPPAAASIGKVFLLGGYLPGTLEPLLNPPLAIRRDGMTTVILSWQVSPLDFLVQGTTNLPANDEEWTVVPGEKGEVDGNYEMNLRILGPARFFRLIPAWIEKL